MKEKKEFNFAERWVDKLAKESESPSKLKTQVLAWGIAGVLLVGVVGSTPWLWEYKVRRDISLVENEALLLSEIANQVKRLKALKVEVEGQQQLQTLIQTSTNDPSPILERLKNILPVGTVVNSFSMQEKAVTLSVSIPTPVDVARLWVSLRESGMFQGVDIQTISLQDKAQTMNFNLTLK